MSDCEATGGGVGPARPAGACSTPADLAGLVAGPAVGYDRRPLDLGELPLAHLPAEVEAALADVEQRGADRLAESLGVPVEAGASRVPALADCDNAAGRYLIGSGRGEPLFTLAEALQEIAVRTCAIEGHDLEVISSEAMGECTPRPVAIICSRPCQFRGYRVVAIGDPDVGELLTAALLDLWADLGAAYDRSPNDPRESSIECNGLITRIVDLTRSLGVTPAEVVPPNLVASGVYVSVHRLAGHVATVAPCTMDVALDQYGELLAERDLVGEGRPAEGGSAR